MKVNGKDSSIYYGSKIKNVPNQKSDKIMVGRLVNPSYLSLWHIMTLTLITLVRTYQVYQHIFSGSILTRLRLTGHLSPMLANQLPPDVEAVWVDSMAFFVLFLLRKRQCQSKYTQSQFSDMLRVRSPFYHFWKCYSNQPFQSSATHFPCWFSLHGTCHVWKLFIYLLNLWPFKYDLIWKFSFSTMKFGTFP